MQVKPCAITTTKKQTMSLPCSSILHVSNTTVCQKHRDYITYSQSLIHTKMFETYSKESKREMERSDIPIALASKDKRISLNYTLG